MATISLITNVAAKFHDPAAREIFFVTTTESITRSITKTITKTITPR
jgi:hypothetical protein